MCVTFPKSMRVGIATLSILLALLSLMPMISDVFAAGKHKVLIPSRKAGMWELVVSSRGRPDVSMLMCIDAKTDTEMMDAWIGSLTGMCPDPIWSRQGDAIVIDSDCTSGGKTIISRAELSGDFLNEHVLSVQTRSGVGAGTQVSLVHTMRFVSETCTSGLIPGGVRLPNGSKMNLKRMLKLIENMNEK